ncbi:hypothetical protein [Nocardioides plantarum]|uniref:Transglutaminase-like domain-containing protein n=1 Tax=Nocardioides plantarum TaxID=29299 RepID=A0ABV5KCB7_9ACTN|nr:hypothetical protein [Nocardioides plantarum]
MSYSERPTLPFLPVRLTARLTVAAAALLVLGACGDDAPETADQPDGGTRPGYPAAVTDSASDTPATVDPPTDPSPSEPTSTSSPSKSPSEPSEPTSSATTDPDPQPELIAYAGGEAQPPLIENRADARRLTGAPKDFQDFIGRAAEKVNQRADCDGAAVGITVDALRTDGYAVGAVNECGGYAAMWAKVDGAWREIEGTQDTWDCAVLKQYRVPSDLLLGSQTCFDYGGDKKEHAYHQA